MHLSDCNWTRNHNHLVHKRTLNHLAKLPNQHPPTPSLPSPLHPFQISGSALDLTLLDATYKTTESSMLMYFLVVQISCGVIVTQEEAILILAKALQTI